LPELDNLAARHSLAQPQNKNLSKLANDCYPLHDIVNLSGNSNKKFIKAEV